MKKKVSLQTKIIGIISIFVFSNLIVLVVGLSKLSSANHTTDEILHVFYKRIELLNKMELDEGKLAIKLRDGMFAENEQDRKQAWQDLEKLNLEIKDLINQQDAIASVEGKASLAKYNEVLDSWFKEVHQVEKLVDEGNLQAARILQREKTVGLRMEMEKILHDLIELNAARMESAGVQSEKEYKSSLFLLVGVSVVCLFFGFVLAFILLRKTNKVINQVIDSLKASAGQVGAASTQLAASSDTQAQATTEQAASLEETAASLEEITAMIAKAADSANATATSSAESQAKAEEGRTSVELMLNSMSEISEGNEAIMRQIEISNQQMTDIVKLIEEIGNKTKVINEIVFQTKLLSFNASVEAARAGEHGKGFAVVAEEVGNLAQMSGNAAKEISDMLTSSISKVENIVTETKSKVEVLAAQGKQKVDSGVDVARQCSEILSEIVMNVTKVSALSQEISLASKEQAQGVSEINKAMGQLDAVTQSNASSSAESATAAEQLSSQSKVLNATVNELVIAIQGGVSAHSPENSIPNSSNLNLNVKKNESKKHLKLKTESPKNLDSNSSKLKLVSGESFVPSHDDSGFAEN